MSENGKTITDTHAVPLKSCPFCGERERRARAQAKCNWCRAAGRVFNTTCGAARPYGDPTDRGAQYCCYCGGRLLIKTGDQEDRS